MLGTKGKLENAPVGRQPFVNLEVPAGVFDRWTPLCQRGKSIGRECAAAVDDTQRGPEEQTI